MSAVEFGIYGPQATSRYADLLATARLAEELGLTSVLVVRPPVHAWRARSPVARGLDHGPWHTYEEQDAEPLVPGEPARTPTSSAAFPTAAT